MRYLAKVETKENKLYRKLQVMVRSEGNDPRLASKT